MKKTCIVINLIISSLLLNGCTTLLFDEAGTNRVGEYKAENDVNITANVKATLIRDNQIDAFDIRVDSYQGVVTLYGHANSYPQITRAIRLARAVNGVKKVNSQLVVIK